MVLVVKTTEFFTVVHKLPEMAMLVSKILTKVKKVMSSGARPDDHWIMGLVLV